MRIFLIKNYRIITMVLFVLVVLPFVALFISGMVSGSNSATLLIIVCFLYFAAISFIKSLLMKGTVKLLFQDCDPYQFLKEARAFSKNEKKKTMKLNFMNWELIGLLNTNKVEEAYDIQKIMEMKMDDKIPLGLKATFAVSFMNICVEKQEISKAEEWMKKVEEMSKVPSFRPHELKRISNATKINRCKIDISIGKTEGCEDKLRNVIEFETRKNVIMECRFLLGKIYIVEKRFDEAKAELDTVIAKGNKLLEVEKAKEFMNKVS